MIMNVQNIVPYLHIQFIDGVQTKERDATQVQFFTRLDNIDELARVKKIYDLKDNYGIEEGNNLETYMNALETSIEKDKNMKTLLDNLKLVFVDNTNNELLKLKYSEIVNVFTNSLTSLSFFKT